MVSGTRALLSKLCLKLKGEQGSGPEGVDDLCFYTYGEFFPPPPPPPPGIGPFGWDLDLKAKIWVSRLGLWPQGWDSGLEARIWASRLGF